MPSPVQHLSAAPAKTPPARLGGGTPSQPAATPASLSFRDALGRASSRPREAASPSPARPERASPVKKSSAIAKARRSRKGPAEADAARDDQDDGEDEVRQAGGAAESQPPVQASASGVTEVTAEQPAEAPAEGEEEHATPEPESTAAQAQGASDAAAVQPVTPPAGGEQTPAEGGEGEAGRAPVGGTAVVRAVTAPAGAGTEATETEPPAAGGEGAAGAAGAALPAGEGDADAGRQANSPRTAGGIGTSRLGAALETPGNDPDAPPAGQEANNAARPSQPSQSVISNLTAAAQTAAVESAAASAPDSASPPQKTTSRTGGESPDLLAPPALDAPAAAGKGPPHAPFAAPAAAGAPEAPPEARFAAVNHAKIVTGVHGELLPNGGAMQLRLDPPELGDLLVSVRMRDGVMTAAFQTSNDEATRLLSHSLGELKSVLEARGVTVERLHVQQAPRQEQQDPTQDGDGRPRQPTPEEQQNARRDQQRREMVQRLWDKLARGKGPLDLVA